MLLGLTKSILRNTFFLHIMCLYLQLHVLELPSNADKATSTVGSFSCRIELCAIYALNLYIVELGDFGHGSASGQTRNGSAGSSKKYRFTVRNFQVLLKVVRFGSCVNFRVRLSKF